MNFKFFARTSPIVVIVGGQRAVENGAVPVSQPENKQDWGQRVGYVRDIDGMTVRMGSYVHPSKQD